LTLGATGLGVIRCWTMSPEPPLDATGIARRQFSTARKGYDPGEVRGFLHEISDVVGRLQRGQAHEHERAERAEERASLAERLDEHRLVELLGEETARVLDAARAAASDIRTKAEESAARLVRESQAEARTTTGQAEKAAATRRLEILAEADELRREAEDEVERRRLEGQVVVDDMRRRAEEERDRMLDDGERARSEAEAAAEQIRASAREQGRKLVGEAQAVRERMLTDLARRRRTAREQLERLNGARERLLAAYEVVKRTVDEATHELTVALPEARLASEVAMRRVSDEPEESVEVLEAELSVARMSGLPDEVASAEVSDDELDAMLRELADEEAAAAAAALAADEAEEASDADDASEGSERPEGSEPSGAGGGGAAEGPAGSGVGGAGHGEAQPGRPPADAWVAVEAQAADPPPDPPGPAREMTDGEKWGIRLPRPRRPAPSEPATADTVTGAGRNQVGPARSEPAGAARAGAAPARSGPAAPTSAGTAPAQANLAAPAGPAPAQANLAAPAGTDPAQAGIAAPAPGEADEGEAGPYVDELFARIRAERVARTAGAAPTAEAASADAAASADTAAEGTPEDDAAPEADVDPATRVLQDRDTVLASVERELGRKLKRVLADEQNEVLDTLRRGGTVEFAQVVPAADEHADRFAIAATADLDVAALHGAALVGGEKAGSCDELAGRLGSTLVAPLRVRIERSFDECDGDLEEVSERLRALYREWKGQRIGSAVRHYTMAAYAAGAYVASGEGAALRWLVDPSCDACPDCDDNALAGDVAKGEAFPTGDTVAPAHPDCRCLVVPAARLAPG
jgi:cell division septum initiation protein DivIVA